MNSWIRNATTWMAITVFYFHSYGQVPSSQLSLGNQSIPSNEIMKNLHHQQIEQGKQYSYFYPAIKGHQFWGQSIYSLGSLTFEGVTYHDILLNYDIYNDLVLMAIIRKGVTANIILDNSRIDGFQMEGENFVNIRSKSGIALGIYRLAFSKNDIQLYIQTKKNLAGNTGEELKKFVTETVQLLIIDGVWHRIESKKDLLTAFAANKDITAFIQATKLKFRNDNKRESSILKVLGEL